MSKAVLCFGDSLTEGHTGGFCFKMMPYADTLRQLAGDEVAVAEAGVSGEKTTTMVERLRSELAARKYDAVVILGGTNDIGTRESAADVVDRLKQMFAQVREHGATVVAVTVPQNGFEGENYEWLEEARTAVNDALRALFADDNADGCLFDLDRAIPHGKRAGQSEFEEFWASDCLHMSAQGYEEFARKLWEAKLKTLLS